MRTHLAVFATPSVKAEAFCGRAPSWADATTKPDYVTCKLCLRKMGRETAVPLRGRP